MYYFASHCQFKIPVINIGNSHSMYITRFGAAYKSKNTSAMLHYIIVGRFDKLIEEMQLFLKDSNLYRTNVTNINCG